MRHYCFASVQLVAAWILQYFWPTTRTVVAVLVRKPRDQNVFIAELLRAIAEEKLSPEVVVQQLYCVDPTGGM